MLETLLIVLENLAVAAGLLFAFGMILHRVFG